MRIVAASPLRAGSLRWQEDPGQYTLTVVCKLTYELAPVAAVLAAEHDELCEGDNHWDDDPARSVYAPSDLVPIKASPEVVLVGSAFSPRGEPVRSLVARLVVGDVDKSLEVYSARAFNLEGQLREGPAWTSMPLRYERAAGGADTINPVGISPDALDPFGRRAVPNLQPAGLFVTSPRDFIAPVGFGPLAAHWPERAGKLRGKVHLLGAESLEDEVLGGDLDPAFFQAAPLDQRLSELAPDQRLVLENLHPDHPRLVTQLPGVRPRARVEPRDAPSWELVLVADTLWIDTQRGICTVTWRGQVPLGEADDQGVVRVGLDEGGEVRWPRSDPPPAMGQESPPGLRGGLGARLGMPGPRTPSDAPPASTRTGAVAPAPALAGPSPALPGSAPPPPMPPSRAMVGATPSPVVAPPPLVTHVPGAAPRAPRSAARPSPSELLDFGHTDVGLDGGLLDEAPASGLPFVPAPPSRPAAPGGVASALPFAPAFPHAPPPSAPPPSASRGAPARLGPSPSTLPTHTLPLGPAPALAAPAAPALAGPAAGVPPPSSAMGSVRPPPLVRAAASPEPLALTPDAPSVWARGAAALGDEPAGGAAGGGSVARGSFTGSAATRAVSAALAPGALASAPDLSWPAGVSIDGVSSPLDPPGAEPSADAPRPEAPAPSPSRARVARTLVELLWFDPAIVEKVREEAAWDDLRAEALAELEARAEPAEPTAREPSPREPSPPSEASPSKPPKPPKPQPDPEAAKKRAERAEVAAVVTRAPSTSDVEAALWELKERRDGREPRDGASARAVVDQGVLDAPLVVVAGELELTLDEGKMLEAMMGAATPFATGDKKLKEVLDLASEVMKTPLAAAPGVASGFVTRLREAWTSVRRLLPADYLDVHTRALLLEKRSYQERELWSGSFLRATLFAPGEPSGVPTYLPAAMAKQLPLFVRFHVRLLAEAFPQQDPAEQHPAALRVAAMGRVVSGRVRSR